MTIKQATQNKKEGGNRMKVIHLTRQEAIQALEEGKDVRTMRSKKVCFLRYDLPYNRLAPRIYTTNEQFHVDVGVSDSCFEIFDPELEYKLCMVEPDD